MWQFWRQLFDPSAQLFLWIVIAVATVECLASLWAATSTQHWFWRGLALWAAVMVMIPIRAWELAATFALTALLIVVIVQIGRRFAPRRSLPADSEQITRPRWTYSLRDLLLLILLVGLSLPFLLAVARNVWSISHWQTCLVGAAFLAPLTVFACRITYGPRRIRAVVLLIFALTLAAFALFRAPDQTYVWMVIGGSGSYPQIIAALIFIELEFVLFLTAIIALIRATQVTARPTGQWIFSVTALTVVAAIATVSLGWLYWQLLQRPPQVAKFELPANHYPRILEIAYRVNAINRTNTASATLRSAMQNSPAAVELESLYAELLPLLAAENAVPYGPERDGTNEYASRSVSDIQVLRGLCRCLRAESESSRSNGQPDLAADYALACLGLSETQGRGGIALNALVGRALEGVAYAQLARLRAELSSGKLREAIQALAADSKKRDDESILRARELDYDERSQGFSARLERTFLLLTRQPPTWERMLREHANRHGASPS